MRVTTDANVVIGSSVLNATGQTTSFSSNGEVRTFNGAKAILMVDADNNDPREMHLPFTNALDDLSPLYDFIEVGGGGGPSAQGILGYDLVVWETGFVGGVGAVSAESGDVIEGYLATGGNMLLSSMGLTTAPADTPELRALFGVGSVINDVGSIEQNGVPGDPITDGMFYVMDWLNPAYNKCDQIDPVSAAGGDVNATIFRNENGQSNAIRRETAEGQRTILNTIWLEGFGEDDDYDDEVAYAMINWLLLGGGDPAGVEDAPFMSSLMNASPNPLSSYADIQFALSDWAAGQNVSLKLVDASGRLVRTLHDGSLEAGVHSMEWDGRDDAGKEVANGLYFAILDSADGSMQTKLMRLR